jgi:hypothetical protein
MVHLREKCLPAKIHRISEICLEQREDEVRIATQPDGQNHLVSPEYTPMKTGTPIGVLKHGAVHHGIRVEDLLLKIDLYGGTQQAGAGLRFFFHFSKTFLHPSP